MVPPCRSESMRYCGQTLGRDPYVAETPPSVNTFGLDSASGRHFPEPRVRTGGSPGSSPTPRSPGAQLAGLGWPGPGQAPGGLAGTEGTARGAWAPRAAWGGPPGQPRPRAAAAPRPPRTAPGPHGSRSPAEPRRARPQRAAASGGEAAPDAAPPPTTAPGEAKEERSRAVPPEAPPLTSSGGRTAKALPSGRHRSPGRPEPGGLCGFRPAPARCARPAPRLRARAPPSPGAQVREAAPGARPGSPSRHTGLALRAPGSAAGLASTTQGTPCARWDWPSAPSTGKQHKIPLRVRSRTGRRDSTLGSLSSQCRFPERQIQNHFSTEAWFDVGEKKAKVIFVLP